MKSIIRATYDIEDITGRQGGFVTYTNLRSEIKNEAVTVVSADSALQTTQYTVTNTLTLRVPNTRLDTTLKEIAAHTDFWTTGLLKPMMWYCN